MVTLLVAGASLALTQSKKPLPDLRTARASAQEFFSFIRVPGGPFTPFGDIRDDRRSEPVVEFLTVERRRITVGVITGDITGYIGPKPVATGGKDLTRKQLERIVQRLAKQRGVEHYETVVFDILRAGDARLDRSKPEGIAFVYLREKDSGPYPVLDFGNTVRIQLGLKMGNLQTYSETRGFVKSKVPASRISAEDAKRIAVNRLRVPGDTNFRAISARLGWVVPDRPNPSKTPGKLEYEFAWDVRLTHDIQARIRASDGKFLGRWSWDSTHEGSLESRKRSGRSPPAR